MARDRNCGDHYYLPCSVRGCVRDQDGVGGKCRKHSRKELAMRKDFESVKRCGQCGARHVGIFANKVGDLCTKCGAAALEPVQEE
jgi:hypothetical protein